MVKWHHENGTAAALVGMLAFIILRGPFLQGIDLSKLATFTPIGILAVYPRFLRILCSVITVLSVIMRRLTFAGHEAAVIE